MKKDVFRKSPFRSLKNRLYNPPCSACSNVFNPQCFFLIKVCFSQCLWLSGPSENQLSISNWVKYIYFFHILLVHFSENQTANSGQLFSFAASRGQNFNSENTKCSPSLCSTNFKASHFPSAFFFLLWRWDLFVSCVPRCCPSTLQLHANMLWFALITAEILQTKAAKMEGDQTESNEASRHHACT